MLADLAAANAGYATIKKFVVNERGTITKMNGLFSKVMGKAADDFDDRHGQKDGPGCRMRQLREVAKVGGAVQIAAIDGRVRGDVGTRDQPIGSGSWDREVRQL